jgi:hypothetical protein
MVLAVSSLSNKGLRPAPRLVMEVKTPSPGWVVLPPLGQPVQVLSSSAAASATQALTVKGQPLWQWSGLAGTSNKPVTWALVGTLPKWRGAPLVIAILLEDANPQWATYIGQQVLQAAMQP